MSYADLERIKSILINEDCTCLCSNCHIMEQSYFFIEQKKQIFFKYKEKYRKCLMREEGFEPPTTWPPAKST